MNPKEVNTREELSRFILQLRDDLLVNSDDWENPTLERFLEALAAYTIAVQGYYRFHKMDIDPDAPNWRVFADILKGARDYE
ncbi:MAG: hypothetical protein KTR29_14795 [Rhodothermaceae bacterium]|nr:hypothetical protein [Rhodothermaceae bacterium]